MSESKISVSFPRDYYLECAEEFEANRIDCVDQELSELNYDEEDLAYELAYTRYTLAREELELEHLRAQVAELVQERDRLCITVKDLSGAMLSVNRSRNQKIMIEGDDEPCYWQREEWVKWIVELANKARESMQ